MHLRLTCPSCGGTTTVPEDLLGSSTACARCGGPLRVPATVLDRDLTEPGFKAAAPRRHWVYTFGVWAVCCGAFAAVALVPLLLARQAHRARPEPTSPAAVGEPGEAGTAAGPGVAGKQPSPAAPAVEEPPLLAGRGGFTCAGMRVDVTAAELGATRVYDTRGNPYIDFARTLKIRLRLENPGKSELAYRGFRDNHATLKDGAGFTYHEKTYPRGQHAEGQEPDGTTVPPGKTVHDCLVFEKPRDNVGALVLELPREPLGGRGTQKILIPREMIKPLEPAK